MHGCISSIYTTLKIFWESEPHYIGLWWSIRPKYINCLRWHFLGTHAYEIKSIDCVLKLEFVLVHEEPRCTMIETFGRKYKTIIEGVFVSAWSDNCLRIFANFHLIYTSGLRERCCVATFALTSSASQQLTHINWLN